MVRYSYDEAGNMRSDGTNNYAYDAEYRILCMNPDPTTWTCNQNSLSYTYDADGRRVAQAFTLLNCPSEYPRVPLDKSEGIVKDKKSLAMRKHRDSRPDF